MKLEDDLNSVRLGIYRRIYKRIWFTKDSNDHHINGPSYIQNNGYLEYRINDRLHNAKGPSIIRRDGSERFYLNSHWLTEKEWQDETGG